MCFGKAIAAESVELPEGLLCEFGRIAALDHAGDQLLLELRDPAGVLESRHSAAELIGFRRREARAFDRNAHRLFLEERDAERLAEHARSDAHTSALQSLMRITYAVLRLNINPST